MAQLQLQSPGGSSCSASASSSSSSSSPTSSISESRRVCLGKLSERRLMVLLCAGCSLLNYADRVNMSVAIIPLKEAYSLSISQQGAVMSAFFAGYTPSQLIAALLCRRYGARNVLATGAALWSALTALTPFAAALGFYTLIAARFAMGLAEGVAFPSVYHFFAGWIPESERGGAISTFLTGVHVGTTLALVTSPKIIEYISWEAVFYIFGLSGFLWIHLWLRFAYDRDSPTSSKSASEVASASTSVAQRLLQKMLLPSEARALLTILTHRSCMAVCFSQFLMNLAHYTILTWLPTYFRVVFHIPTAQLSFTFLPYLAMALVARLGGLLADTLISKHGMRIGAARKFTTAVANTGAAVLIVLFAIAQNEYVALALIAGSLAFMSLNAGGFESSFLDCAAPQFAGLFKSVANTMGACAGALAIWISTWILDVSNDNWRFVFGSLGIWHLLGTFVFCIYGSGERAVDADGYRMDYAALPER